jgi:phospho-N-acetylmuramoyl-pentapeptide-transferase
MSTVGCAVACGDRAFEFGSYVPYAVVAFVIAAGLGWPAILLLRRLSFRQKAYEDAPQSHALKTGTPTMGGLIFAAVLLLFCGLAWHVPPMRVPFVDLSPAVLELAGLGLACGAIGFADDCMGIVLGRNRGLGARTKFALTGVAGVLFLVAVAATPWHVSTSFLAIGNFAFPVPEWLWYALGMAVVLSTTHAVNLTDGLDGLAAGTIVAPLVLLAYMAARRYDTWAVGAVDLVTVGAVLGFLIYNRHPAKVFMGDTGSLLLGGILAGSAIMLDQQLLLPLIGGVFAAEALSVIIQVAYFKRTKKRIFRMSPLHHHFELGGWPETKVTTRFWVASLALSLVGLGLTAIGSPAS